MYYSNSYSMMWLTVRVRIVGTETEKGTKRERETERERYRERKKEREREKLIHLFFIYNYI